MVKKKVPEKKVSIIELYNRDKNYALWVEIKKLSKAKRPNFSTLLKLIHRDSAEFDEVPLATVHKIMKELLQLDKKLEKALEELKSAPRSKVHGKIGKVMKKLKLKGPWPTYHRDARGKMVAASANLRNWPEFFLKKKLHDLNKKLDQEPSHQRTMLAIENEIHTTKQEEKKLKGKKSKKNQKKLAELKLKLYRLSMDFKLAHIVYIQKKKAKYPRAPSVFDTRNSWPSARARARAVAGSNKRSHKTNIWESFPSKDRI